MYECLWIGMNLYITNFYFFLTAVLKEASVCVSLTRDYLEVCVLLGDPVQFSLASLYLNFFKYKTTLILKCFEFWWKITHVMKSLISPRLAKQVFLLFFCLMFRTWYILFLRLVLGCCIFARREIVPICSSPLCNAATFLRVYCILIII